MDAFTCPSYESCDCPLCPLEPSAHTQWFPGEAICNSKVVTKPPWVKTQRKIRRLFSKGLITADDCFTISMLEDIKRVGKGLHGIKPENLYRNRTGEDAQKPSISHRMPFLKAEKRGITNSCV